VAIAAAGGLGSERNAAVAQQGRAENAERTLSSQLELTRRAEREKEDQLWQSRLDRARAGRFSRRCEQRFKSLSVRDGHQNAVTRLAFSHAGHLLLSTGWDETIRVWDPWALGAWSAGRFAALSR
jgi:hypothetical protein